jgi:hypothetical protein
MAGASLPLMIPNWPQRSPPIGAGGPFFWNLAWRGRSRVLAPGKSPSNPSREKQTSKGWRSRHGSALGPFPMVRQLRK